MNYSVEEIKQYREGILKCMLEATENGGSRALSEDEICLRLNMLTDDELAEGMPFNTCEDVAEVLMQD